MPYKKIVVALSGKENEESVIHEAVRLSNGLNAVLTVLHVQDPHAGKVSMMMETARLVTEEDLRNQFRRLGYDKEAEAMRVNIEIGASYPKVIARVTEDADLLVIGHRQKHGFLSAFIDSVDKHVADLITCPVLIVPRQHTGADSS